ncbi:MAG: hypothetical protein A3F72_01095 [Bacteroidetes bacterium RIFCSPLOWO2_12_FULL_35_15]|nr:MAG: hypothetical protein A3F72_01095 [Bacteroidetes bacterium RIFCSPLOWO2_12_FULL_35_15]
MKYFINLFFFFFLSTFCFAQDTTVQSKIKYYSEKTDKYLDKQKMLSSYYSIDKRGVSVYASAQDKLKNNSEYFVPWHQHQEFCKYSKEYDSRSLLKIVRDKKLDSLISTTIKNEKVEPSKNKLKGFKIAIDAGHIAGDIAMGELEKKYLDFKKDSIKGLPDSIQIAEGMLTFATAKLLKEKLEAEGAEVFLTRKCNGCSAFGKTFEQWLKEDYKKTIDSLYKINEFSDEKKKWYLSSKCSKRDKFRLIFKDLDLQKRAEIINNYKPDFTVIIHFNVDETNSGWTKPGSKNFNMTFVGGAFMKSDLFSAEKRFEFLRLLLSDDLERSIALSSSVVSSFEKNLNVKTACVNDARYLVQGCLPTTEKGVFCRNLQLTRYIHSPLVYGETLYQDNISECKELNKECDKTKNERIQQVAEAYYQGILIYVKKLQAQ